MLRMSLLLLFGFIAISIQTQLQQHLAIWAVMSGTMWSINYWLQTTAKVFFWQATLVLFFSIQDAYKGNIPFTTMLAISLYFEVKRLFFERHQRSDRLERPYQARPNILDFSLFFIFANTANIVILKISGQLSGGIAGLVPELVISAFPTSIASFMIIKMLIRERVNCCNQSHNKA